ncbi:cytochrome P450 [Macrolepiota fuliginosa MF-IS2]|uniref:Cytochrome P450 n=1 Tax=Macrolepiota fuliginosa MF-IS2 TaxID=1400762 RepID=A0A9P5X687_9AGAR|nr:cytochrome P450 [Macrolepiota fuliginosa MF-IS2]
MLFSKADSITLVLILLSTFYITAYVRHKRSPLNRIPTVGFSGPVMSHLGALVSFVRGHHLVQEGYEKYRIFKIRRYFSWLVIVNGPQHLEDIRKATDDKLSFLDALSEAGQLDHTIGPELRNGSYHVNVVRGPMTRSINSCFPSLLDEMDKALGDILREADKDWASIPCYHSVVHVISRVSARFFVGPKLSANPRYTEIMQGYTTYVFRTAFVLRLVPTLLKPIANRIMFDTNGRLREVEEFLQPLLTERLEQRTMEDNAEHEDMITWLWDAAPEQQRTIRDLAVRMILLNVAAIHTTSSLLTHVLFNLATYTSYVEPLREEITTVIKEHGWNKVAIEKMRKLDSFIKESERLHGSGAVVLSRLTVNDFTFSDGTFIPKGTHLVANSRAISHDENYYTDPQEFQGFRFADMNPLKWQMTALNPEYMLFGLGRHACPGRFFAVAEIKAIVARILLNYDIKLTDEEAGRPKDVWFTGLFIAPTRKARISLKKRVD